MSGIATNWSMYEAVTQDPIERWVLTYMAESVTFEGLFVSFHGPDVREVLVLDVASRIGVHPSTVLAALARLGRRGLLVGLTQADFLAMFRLSAGDDPLSADLEIRLRRRFEQLGITDCILVHESLLTGLVSPRRPGVRG